MPENADLVSIIEKALAARWTAEHLTNDSDPEVDAHVALEAIEQAGYEIRRRPQNSQVKVLVTHDNGTTTTYLVRRDPIVPRPDTGS